MANRPKEIENTNLQMAILSRMPKLPKSVDAKTLLKQLEDAGISRDIRTIQRTLKTLCESFDIECNYESKPYTYAWKERSNGLALPVLSEQQSLLLKLAEQQLKYLLPANIMSSMQPFFDQADRMVSGTYPNGKEKPVHQWLGKVCATPTSLPLIPAKIKDGIFEAVSQALFQNKLLHIDYRNQWGKKSTATIMPLAISQQGASIYLVCRFEGFDDNRLLALHRLQKAEISTFSFERPVDFNLQRYQDEGNLGFSNQGKIRLSFSIERGEGFHLTETPLSKDQKLLEESEEHYRFQATVADNDMLKWWLRRFGDNIWDIEKEPL
ncbi:helix-turn-helix transcriptional regulator [Mannheimia massilioguelmaensis]|uniref:helix-turn-helix transcriptional regulator n=1 Tax=Mannheimia massilioguelmaensis TaxID=1604354 RepID=UPI0005CA76F6|nr:WYL domain-containing protein [Mannheimia massilioguelmaensis]